jgi:hypothetical protein
MIFKNDFLYVIRVAKFFLGITVLDYSCVTNNNKDEMQISLFTPVCYIDTIQNNNQIHTYKIVSYLIEGYQNTALFEEQIDSFVCSIQDSTWLLYDECNILFYKKSKYTNNEHIQEAPRDLYRYSQDNDFLYQYRWSTKYGYSKISLKGKTHFDNVNCDKKR